MKKVIKNRVYDTETAEAVGEWNNGRYGRDFERCSETLYRKRTGEFFLYGEGGPLSKYAVHRGNETSGGEVITPLTLEEAQEWAEENLDGDEYEKLFGEIVEGEPSVLLGTRLPASTVEKVKRAAQSIGMTISAYVDFKLNS